MTDKPVNQQSVVATGILGKLGAAIASAILPKLIELLWPKLEEYLEKRLLPWLASLIPLASASAVNAVIDNIPGVEAVKDVGALIEKVTKDVNVAVPDFDLPFGISDHFDLTEFINQQLGRRN